MPADPDGNFAPTALNDALSTGEADIVQGNLLANDSDPNGDTLSLVSVEGVEAGPITLASGAVVNFTADGNVTYDPNGAFDALNEGQTAIDIFTYSISDGRGGVAEATATVTIAGAGGMPTATTVLVDFDTAVQTSPTTVTDDGFVFADANLADGSATSLGGSMTVTAADGDMFDFENGIFNVSGRGREQLTLEGYLDGVLVASESFNLRAGRDDNVAPTDPSFDTIDELVILSSNGVTVDDLSFVV